MYDLSNYVKPFKENEVPNVGLANVCSRSLIEKHQKCIEILEGIMHFEQRKKHRIENIEGFAGTFPELRRKYVNDIDTINRCIKRLEDSYKRVLHGCKQRN